MKFECPHCHQHLETATLYKGQGTKCPQCGGDLQIPDPDGRRQAAPLQESPTPVGASLVDARDESGAPAHEPSRGEVALSPELEAARPRAATDPSAARAAPTPVPPEGCPEGGVGSDDFRMDFTAARRIIQERLDKESKSLHQVLAEKGVDPSDAGTPLLSRRSASAEADAGALSEKGLITDSAHGKYEVGDTVAKGGMGAILEVRDVNVRRHVAMKVMLDPKTANKEDLLRFVHEAQITGQLEHPGIVPLHELGVDSSGNPYYTMKYVKGRTLKDVLRDLKPENIMIGEYGEVLVMDWGLAKVLEAKGMVKKPTPALGHPSKGRGTRNFRIPSSEGVVSFRRDRGRW